MAAFALFSASEKNEEPITKGASVVHPRCHLKAEATFEPVRPDDIRCKACSSHAVEHFRRECKHMPCSLVDGLKSLSSKHLYPTVLKFMYSSRRNLERESVAEMDALDIVHNGGTHFFDLPQEIRDMIYAYFPYRASIHINQAPSIVVQPDISKVCRQMRKEFLDIFYSRNNFFLDLRGWKDASYPKAWTPHMIFERWITAIGDDNAARLRSISFFSHNFRVNVKISNEMPPKLAMRFRTSDVKAEVVEGVSSSYTFDIAATRAEKGLRQLLDLIQAERLKRGLGADDMIAISRAVDTIQPFLCRRANLGYRGVVLQEEDIDMESWPSVASHLDMCDDCGYHRWTRGAD